MIYNSKEKPDYVDDEQLYQRLCELENDVMYLYKKLHILDETKYLTPSKEAIESNIKFAKENGYICRYNSKQINIVDHSISYGSWVFSEKKWWMFWR